MSVIGVWEAAGTAASTTTGLLFAAMAPTDQPVLFAECDPSGGDVAAWSQRSETPGWATAVAGGNRSWASLRAHLQELPSGLGVLCAPTVGRQARVVVREAASRFGPLLASMADVVAFADCGRVDGEPPAWLSYSQLVVLLVRQATTSSGATVARVERAGEALELLRSVEAGVGVVVIGARPYPPVELAEILGVDLVGVLPEDPIGAGLAAGGWTVGRGASRSALARAARPLSAHLVDTVAGAGTAVGSQRVVRREVAS